MKTIELKLIENENYFIREAFNTLRTNVLFCEKNVKTILIISAAAHEGKTTVALELSKCLALANKKVLFVDADLRMSVAASRHTNARGVVGLSQVLSGQAAVEEAIYHTQLEGLDIVLAGPFPPNPVDLLDGETFKDFIRTQRENYDFVIIDSPPLGMVVDAAVIGAVADGAILVIGTGMIKYRREQVVKDQLEKSGCKILGAVLNTASRKSSLGGVKYGYYSKYRSSSAQYTSKESKTKRKKK